MTKDKIIFTFLKSKNQYETNKIRIETSSSVSFIDEFQFNIIKKESEKQCLIKWKKELVKELKETSQLEKDYIHGIIYRINYKIDKLK